MRIGNGERSTGGKVREMRAMSDRRTKVETVNGKRDSWRPRGQERWGEKIRP